MKITKRQLKKIIKEERQKLLKEYGAMDMEVISPLVQFAQAYSGLGDAIQSQVIELSNAHGTARFEDVVYELNPNALDSAFERLQQSLSALARAGSEDAMDIYYAMEAAAEIFAQEYPGPNG